jgi:hypothetical protein
MPGTDAATSHLQRSLVTLGVRQDRQSAAGVARSGKAIEIDPCWAFLNDREVIRDCLHTVFDAQNGADLLEAMLRE